MMRALSRGGFVYNSHSTNIRAVALKESAHVHTNDIIRFKYLVSGIWMGMPRIICDGQDEEENHVCAGFKQTLNQADGNQLLRLTRP